VKLVFRTIGSQPVCKGIVLFAGFIFVTAQVQLETVSSSLHVH